MATEDYVTRVFASPSDLPAAQWDALVSADENASPFIRHAYLTALHESGCAREQTGWQPQYLTLWRDGELHAASPMYLKNHSYGEYVFDWAWANAYAQHGLDYYPKALVAVPFTPVQGSRLLAKDDHARSALVRALIHHTREENLSSLHLLFIQPREADACAEAGMLLRDTVQFHWQNRVPAPSSGPVRLPQASPEDDPGPSGCSSGPDEEARQFRDFEHFLASLVQDKRKKIRQERRKVAEAGVRFRWAQGTEIDATDWDFFYRCYERTYLEHGNAPYLNRDFFQRMTQTMPDNWLLFVALREGRPIACSLVAIDPRKRVAYGRYWGALERVDCLHFEACYYQPLEWCIRHGFVRFEGGAQGEHKMARALLPVKTSSAHWLAHPAFSDAVERFLERESRGVGEYLDHLAVRLPLKGLPRRAPA